MHKYLFSLASHSHEYGFFTETAHWTATLDNRLVTVTHDQPADRKICLCENGPLDPTSELDMKPVDFCHKLVMEKCCFLVFFMLELSFRDTFNR